MLFPVRQFYPTVGGFENIEYQIASVQAVNGHVVRVVTLDRLVKTDTPGKLPARGMVGGFEIIRIPLLFSAPSACRRS